MHDSYVHLIYWGTTSPHYQLDIHLAATCSRVRSRPGEPHHVIESDAWATQRRMQGDRNNVVFLTCKTGGRERSREQGASDLLYLEQLFSAMLLCIQLVATPMQFCCGSESKYANRLFVFARGHFQTSLVLLVTLADCASFLPLF